MPYSYDLKPAFQDLLHPIARKLATAGVTANQVTLSALALSCLVGTAIAWHHDDSRILLLVPLTMFVRMTLNTIDGMLAREHNMKSNLGVILNELGDAVSDAALYLPFALIPGLTSWLIIGIVVLAGLSEMTGLVAIQINASRRYDGPMGKGARAFVFGSVALLLGVGAPTGAWLNAVLGITLLLLVITIFNRARRGLAEAP